MNLAKPQVLVTGLSGLIGRLFQRLYGADYDLINLDLTTGIDITNQTQVREAFRRSKAQAVIHLAAYTNVSAAHNEQGDKDGICYKVNVLGTQTIAQAASREHKYLIHISTDYVFDGSKTEPYTETDTPHPIEWYGQTKYWAEEAVLQSGANHVILRLAFPYQAKPSRPDFLAKIVDNLTKNTLPPAFTDHVITPTFANNVAQVFDYCLKHQPTGLYHMTGASAHSDYEIGLIVKDIFRLPGEVKPGSLAKYLEVVKRPYQKTMRISNQKLTHDFGLTMLPLKAGLEQVLALINS